MALDVNDIRHFAAVARAGSTLAAAQALRVNQTTCARRIAALERALGLTLFERASTGYRLTPGGAQLLAHAERLEQAAAELEQAAANLTRAQRAEIRFSTSDVLADLVAGPAIASFARLHPDIRVALRVDSRAVDLTGREADIALRRTRNDGKGARGAKNHGNALGVLLCVHLRSRSRNAKNT